MAWRESSPYTSGSPLVDLRRRGFRVARHVVLSLRARPQGNTVADQSALFCCLVFLDPDLQPRFAFVERVVLILHALTLEWRRASTMYPIGQQTPLVLRFHRSSSLVRPLREPRVLAFKENI